MFAFERKKQNYWKFPTWSPCLCIWVRLAADISTWQVPQLRVGTSKWPAWAQPSVWLASTFKLGPSLATAVAAVAHLQQWVSGSGLTSKSAKGSPSVKPTKSLKQNSTEIVRSSCGVWFHFRFPRLSHAFLVYLMLYCTLNKTNEFHQFVSELLLWILSLLPPFVGTIRECLVEPPWYGEC